MKRASTLFALAMAALVFQGALATQLPPPWCPDLTLLVLIGIGLRWQGVAGGLVLAAGVGYATDLLSGSLFGQHALLDLFAFVATGVAARQLNLRGSWPLAVFAMGLTLAYGAAMLAVTSFFVGGVDLGWSWLGAQLAHAGSCGLFAPAMSSLVGRAASWADDEPGRRTLGLGAVGRPV